MTSEAEAETRDGGVVCDICGEEFDSEADLQEHLYSIGIVD